MSYPARLEGLVNSTLSHIISLNPPTRSLSITGHWNVSLPSGASLWNGIFGRFKGQNTTLMHMDKINMFAKMKENKTTYSWDIRMELSIEKMYYGKK